jgi:uncharacterized membrane protein
VDRSRVETFSDGIFAIAITLLVLTIAQPDNYHRLGRSLVDVWPSFAAYIVSFAIIGIMWLNHHTVFAVIERIDRPAFYWNLLLLMTIVFLPYPTGIFGTALGKDDGARVAAVFYSLTMAVNAYSWAGLWLYASGRRRLLRPDFPEERRRSATVGFTIGGVLYTVVVGVALINAYLCLACHAALAFYYALDPISRQAAKRGAGT